MKCPSNLHLAMGVWGRISSLEGILDLRDKGMNKRIYIQGPPKEKKDDVLDRCKQCLCLHNSVHAKLYNRQGFCGKRCKRYFKKKSIKWRNGKGRLARQINRQLNITRSESGLDFYNTPEWRDLRFRVLRAYKYRCMACGAGPDTGPLHVDHIKPRSIYPRLQLEFDNLQVLCRDCNLGKGNMSEDDLRPEPDFLTEAARKGLA